jgi:hypothetical protein
MKNLALIAIALAFLSGSVQSNTLNNYLDFYIGADGQLRVTKFKKGFGNNLLKKTYPQGNIYAGVMLSENIGAEAGYESTTERACDATLWDGECCAGRHVPPAAGVATFKTKLRIKGPHVGLILFHPLKDSRISLLGSVGLSFVKGTAEIKTTRLGFPPIEGATRCLSKHKEALRFMGGAQYLTRSGLGFRGTMSFIKTRKIVLKKSDDNSSIQIPRIKLRDSVVYGLGAFWVF